jgi:hypothetical protein
MNQNSYYYQKDYFNVAAFAQNQLESSQSTTEPPFINSKRMPLPRQRVKENSRLLPQKAVDIMTQWYDRNYSHPYPQYRELEQMALAGCITINQVKQWFVNIRRRTENQYRKKRDNTVGNRKRARSTKQVDQDDESSTQLQINEQVNFNYSEDSLIQSGEKEVECDLTINYNIGYCSSYEQTKLFNDYYSSKLGSPNNSYSSADSSYSSAYSTSVSPTINSAYSPSQYYSSNFYLSNPYFYNKNFSYNYY